MPLKQLLRGTVRHFTTDQAVRAGVITAAWAAAASYGRGLLPRTAVQQAAITGVSATAYYALGTTTWATVSSVAAGVPGQRPGVTARLVAAGVTAGAGKVAEQALQPSSGENLLAGIAWSEMKLLSVSGLAGGLVTVSDIVAHEMFHRNRTPLTTLALDLTMGLGMAATTVARRAHRARRYGADTHLLTAVKRFNPEDKLSVRARTAAVATATVAGSAAGLATLAITEQAGARLVTAGINRMARRDLGEFSDFLGHGVMFTGFTAIGVGALRYVRRMTQQKQEVIEPAYRESPTSPFVSSGPTSEVQFDDIGKEGRRFVLMRLTTDEIEKVMGGTAQEPVRVVIPREGTIEERADLAVRELVATGGINRSVICIASPTGVGYVNYIMAEALEYLSRGDCAVVVPQYAYVPSALALNKTREGASLQREVIEAVSNRLDELQPTRRPQIVNFGESLGAQCAVDVGWPDGVPLFDAAGLDSGLYLGVPFRSQLWLQWLTDPQSLSYDGRLLNVATSMELTRGERRHVMLNHDDDPINKFSYDMVVRRPWWMGPSHTRPPLVPRETLFRPVISFVIAVVDLLNGMDSKPGEFVRVGHDYRADLREAIEKAYDLPATTDQRDRIESALRHREQEWAERRLIAKTGEKALRQLRDTINSWGQDVVNLPVDENPGDDASNRLIDYLNDRLGQSGGSGLG